jgi:hypothetical protein
MSKYTLGIIIAGCAAGLLCSPARADVIFSIDPVTVSASPGDVGDAFDVVLTNSSNASSNISIAAFFFEVTVADADITLTGADYSTGAIPYIFAGDSFDEINALGLSFAGIDTTPQTLQAGDVTNDVTNVVLTPGESLALGEVLFNVAPGATPGPFTVSFTGSTGVANLNDLSDASGDTINVDTFDSGTIQVSGTSTVPEPATTPFLAGALLIGVLFIRKRRRHLA